MHYATPQTVCVRDEEGVMAFNREDLLRYSGLGHLIASALVLRLFQEAFARLSPQEPPMKTDIRVLSAFPGLGVRDHVELVTRAITDGRFVLDTDAGPKEAPRSAIGGRMYFEVAVKDRAVSFVLNPEIFDEHWCEQVARFQKGQNCTREEHAQYVAYKYQFVGQVLTRDDVFAKVEEIDATALIERTTR